MTKINLTDLVNLQNETTAVNAINTNNAILETASNNTLSRDGTSPNQMNAAIDMNNNQIYNLPAPSTVNAPARLIDVTSNPTIVVPGTGTSGHTVPFLDGNNTWSGTNAFSAAVTVPSGTAITNAALTTPTMTAPVLGTPASGTMTNVTGLPISTGVSGLAAGVATFLATPNSANLRTAMTDETGTGANVFATTPTIATPNIDTINLTGGQITFPAVAVPSGGANTLDDYEEGSWTPSVRFGAASVGITYSQQTGSYTKIGRFVTARFNLTLTSKGSSTGNMDIAGLPINSTNGLGGYLFNASNMTSWAASGVDVQTNTANIQLVTTTGYAQATNANFNNTSAIFGVMYYEAA